MGLNHCLHNNKFRNTFYRTSFFEENLCLFHLDQSIQNSWHSPVLSENNKIIVVLSADTNIILVSVID